VLTLRDGSTGTRAHYGPHSQTKLTTMREVESMREVEGEDGSLAALGL
jgi:hypothetical protein